MRSKRLIQLVYTVLTALGIASSPLTASCDYDFDGFYAGAEVSYVSSVAKYKRIIPNPTAFPFTVVNSFGLEGCDFGGHLGWGKTFCMPCNSFQVYYGLEASGLYVHASGHDNFHEITQLPLPPGGILNFDLSAKIKDSYQIAFRCGLPLHRAMPYLKIGYNNAKWNINAKNSPLLNAVANLRSNQISKRFHGFLVGIGTDILLSPRVIFGFQFDWTIFNKQTISLASKTVPDFNPDARAEFKPYYSRLTFKLTYLF